MSLFFKGLLSVLALPMFVTISLKAQSVTQTVSGKLVDRESNTSWPGANVVVIESDSTMDDDVAGTRARAKNTLTVTRTSSHPFNAQPHLKTRYLKSDGPAFQNNLFSKPISLKSVAFRKAVIAPVLFTAAGLSTLADDNDDNYEVQKERKK